MITAWHPNKGPQTLVLIAVSPAVVVVDVFVLAVAASADVHRGSAFLWHDSNPIRMDGPHKNKKRLLLFQHTEAGMP